MDICRYKIDITGTVQGIGFRPFVYKEAVKRAIVGHVFNHSSGVTIEAQSSAPRLEDFINSIRNDHPPFADIHSIKHQVIEPNGETEFKIIESLSQGTAETLISADIATCDDCLRDINDPANRRYKYPFTNCTNCGPRYTIIEGVPYDRPLTAMKGFKMCQECEAEYNDPMDRRYHAQPIACSRCGPKLNLVKAQNPKSKPASPEIPSLKSQIPNKSKAQNPKGNFIKDTIKLLADGNIVAIKGLGGFHMACDATNEEAVLRLRERKKRDEKPFAVMMRDVETVREYCELSESEEKILTSAQRPIVLLRRKVQTSTIAKSVAPNNCYIGVMLPYTPLHHLLLQDRPLVMTSANISDEPICLENNETLERLKDIADYFLMHDRDIYIRTDDSITRVMDNKPLMLRRARGYVPQSVLLDTRCSMPDTHHILAVGAELKNTVCLLKGNKAFLSQHIGDLENSASYDSFQQTIDHLQKIYDVRPLVIAHDMHPDYFSTRWVMRATPTGPDAPGYPAGKVVVLGHPSASPIDFESDNEVQRTARGETSAPPPDCELIEVQHHHAHIASCMAENRIGGPVIGIALDGTGFGTDGNIWGGEILVADYKGFERVGQFEYVQMPGGEAAIKNPWMMALAYLAKSQTSNPKSQTSRLELFSNIPGHKVKLVLSMIDRGINCPLTSSCGRLFDAVAALLGLRQSVSYEGQAALELEMRASQIPKPQFKIPNPKYRHDIIVNNNYITISYRPTIKAILEELNSGVSKSEIALRFHYTIIAALTEAATKVSGQNGIREVALSGGCFQNVLLTEGLKKSLEDSGFKVYTHSLIPPNDGGISLGQAAIAGATA